MTNFGTKAYDEARQTFREKQAALEAGFLALERDLQALGARIEDCRDQMEAPSSIAHMAVNASRLERKFLSLRKKMKETGEIQPNPATQKAIRELSEIQRQKRFNTKALERETRRNSKILNALAEKLKAELNKKRAEELKAAREKAAQVKARQNPPRIERPALRAVPRKSAEIVPFPLRGVKRGN